MTLTTILAAAEHSGGSFTHAMVYWAVVVGLAVLGLIRRWPDKDAKNLIEFLLLIAALGLSGWAVFGKMMES